MKQTPTNNPNNADRGLAGVAALIIFIAIVLVGAITAAVILDVSGSLEQQAAQTGEDASNQISSTLQILERTADVDGGGDGLESISYIVSVAPGTPSYQLDDMLITKTGEDQRFDIVSENEDDAQSDDEFTITPIVPGDADATVIQGPQQRFEITVSTANVDNLNYPRNEQYDVVFTAGEGGQAFQSVRVPSTLPADGTISI